MNTGFSRPEIVPLELGLEPALISQDGRDISIRPVFFKVHVNSELDLKTRNLTWVDKREFIGAEVCDANTGVLLSLLRTDRVERELGLNVLQCVDILVFREHEGEYEFLMLDRRHPKEDYGGWEYPKGGLEYHETIHEGAMRELLEETGLDSSGGFRYGGYLGYQTVDVSWRGKPTYDTLRVHGVTYLFYGRPDDVKMVRAAEGHVNHTWMPLSQAKESIWVGAYGQVFFDRWHAQRLHILRKIARPISLAYEMTENCPIGCKFCHRRIDGEPDPSLEDQKTLINILADRGVLRLTITGGEPTLPRHKETTFLLLEHAHSRKLHTCLSTTGSGLEKKDIARLDRCLDQLLLSFHSSDDALALELYPNASTYKTLRKRFEEVLQWTADSKIIVEVCTVVSRANLNNILALGHWLFALRPSVFWRLDEYYCNGKQDSLRSTFEVPADEFAKLLSRIQADFPTQLENKQIRWSTKEGRQEAPDIMITPQGNFVTSSNNEYSLRGSMTDLVFVELKNRRPWREYLECIRTDWNW